MQEKNALNAKVFSVTRTVLFARARLAKYKYLPIFTIRDLGIVDAEDPESGATAILNE